jgi:hypothetical protein
VREPTIDVVADLLRQDGVTLEHVKAVVTAEQLAQGIDLLRINVNETTFIGGITVEDQVWQSVRFSSEDPSVHVVISVGPDIIGRFSVDAVGSCLARQRITKMRLVKPGSPVRVVARSKSPLVYSRVMLEIFGWAVLQEWLPAVEAALALLESS